MINFFRKSRKNLAAENKVSKYLLYSIGEIILVVLGILIALKINNWNDKQKLILQERDLLENVLENIKTDSISIDSVLSATNKNLEVHHNLIRFSKQEISKNEVGNIDLIRKSEPNQLITQINNPDLPNSLLDQELKKVILNYYLAIEWFEKTVFDNNKIIEDYIRPLLAENELLNFDVELSGLEERLKLHNGSNMGLNLINESKFFEAFKENEIKQYLLESRLKLNVMKLFAKRIAKINNDTKEAIQKYINME